jgi:hypothetical protein
VTTSEGKWKLDVLTVKAPCPESWDRMEGDDVARFCGVCRQNVYDLSAMTRERAEQLLAEREGRVCVRFYRRADGTVSTADCAPARFRALRQAARRSMALASALVASLLGVVVALGVARVGGFDLSRWLERSPVGYFPLEPTQGEPMIDEPPVELLGEPMMDPGHDPAGRLGGE